LSERRLILILSSRAIRAPFTWIAVCLLVLVSLGSRASAQSAADVMSSVGIEAAAAARDAVRAHEALLKRALLASPAPSDAETPPPPITESNVSKPQFLGDPLTYEADISTMFAGGNTNNGFANPPGGFDASLLYKLTRTTRAYAGFYEFSATPLGSDDPNTPVVFQGTTTPIAAINTAALRVDATTHLRFQIYNLQQMFTIGGWHHPLVIAPTYVSVRSSIGGTDDTGTLFANNEILTNVHQRSYETKGINLAIPLFYGEKYFIAYTGGPIWNMNLNGANLTNHPQLLQSLYADYQPSEQLTLFANLINSITYFPTDVYPYHVPTFHYGISEVIKKPFFIEAEVSTGGPSNPNYTDIGRIGIADFTVPCARTAAGGTPTLTCVALAQNGVAVPVIGAQRYTTFTLMLGIGAAPLVRPF
jgi:hypothetical protein